MKNESKVVVKLDLRRIFLTPPNTKKEKIGLYTLMVAFFVMFFAPIIFTDIHPVQAIFISCIPALTTSWGWMVLCRSLFRKKDFCK